MYRVLALLLFGIILPAAVSPPPANIDRFGWWDAPPVLHVCPSYEGQPSHVRRAVRKIRRHGGDIRRVEWGRCDGELHPNEIWLAGEYYGMHQWAAGETQFAVVGSSVAAAIVFVRAEYAGGPTLEHELLHAMGLAFDHTLEPGHIMHPNNYYGGPSWSGVREALARERPE